MNQIVPVVEPPNIVIDDPQVDVQPPDPVVLAPKPNQNYESKEIKIDGEEEHKTREP